MRRTPSPCFLSRVHPAPASQKLSILSMRRSGASVTSATEAKPPVSTCKCDPTDGVLLCLPAALASAAEMASTQGAESLHAGTCEAVVAVQRHASPCHGSRRCPVQTTAHTTLITKAKGRQTFVKAACRSGWSKVNLHTSPRTSVDQGKERKVNAQRGAPVKPR